MNILVTGSAGRVGRRLVGELLAAEHAVTSVDLRDPGVTRPSLTHHSGSIADPEFVERVVNNVDAVVHLSALMSWKDEDAERMFEANVNGTERLLESVSRRPLRRFVLASSGEVYPENNPVKLPIDEDHRTAPTSFYGFTKHLAEESVRFFMRRDKLKGVILRFSHTQDAPELFDPESWFSGPRFFLSRKLQTARERGQHEVAEALARYDDGEEKLVISRGRDGTPFRMHITETADIVQGVVRALEREEAVGETFNIGSDDPISFDEVVPRMSEYLGIPTADIRLPVDAPNYRTSNQKAKRLLGFQPRWDFARMMKEGAEFRHTRGE